MDEIDYNEKLSRVLKTCSIRVLKSFLNQCNLELEQMSIKITFLHEYIEETVYMEHPECLVEDKTKVCLLKKYLYGLKQGSRQCYFLFDEFILKRGFVRSNHDSCACILKMNEKFVMYLLLYVDDILMESSSKIAIGELKEILDGKFEMKYLGKAKRIMGTNIMRSFKKSELFLSQYSYLKKVIEQFRT